MKLSDLKGSYQEQARMQLLKATSRPRKTEIEANVPQDTKSAPEADLGRKTPAYPIHRAVSVGGHILRYPHWPEKFSDTEKEAVSHLTNKLTLLRSLHSRELVIPHPRGQ